ncbi:MAG: hypothetical protein AD742_05940 [Methylibium sp. NZG]|nr:MAG: hypothetical protein AD742_05940 [Methylibium sp. NZG]
MACRQAHAESITMNAMQLAAASGGPLARPPPLVGVTPEWVRSQLIGREASTRTPFGERRIVYADLGERRLPRKRAG